MRRGSNTIAAYFAAALLALVAQSARAQGTGDVLGNPDTLFEHPSRTPLGYDTSYDRNVSSGTWTQALSYSITRPRVAFSGNGNFTSVDQMNVGSGGASGTFGGMLNFRATPHWMVGLNGNFNHVATHDLIENKESTTSQRQNRLRVNSTYNANPLRQLSFAGLVYTEFQQDHALTIRPLVTERELKFTRRDSAGDSVGVDSFFVHDHRDSTYINGRQDGLNASMDWRPSAWLKWTSSVTASRVNQTTTTRYRDFARTVPSGQVELASDSTSENPNNSESYQTKFTLTGHRGLVASVNLRDLSNNQSFYNQSIQHVENLSVQQRGVLGHAEYAPFRGAQWSLDSKIESIFSQYRFQTRNTNYVLSRTLGTSFNYSPNPRFRSGLNFNVENRENLRQETGNGRTLFRFAQVSTSYRVSSRLGLDGSGMVTLLSSQYLDAFRDQDNLRTYINAGGVYQVSARCSTFVHFSTTRTHQVAIAATRSGDNNVESTYQMDATLKLGLTPRISLLQNYLLSAIYRINDSELSESRNVLSRNKRIDTTLADSLFPFATMQIVHNFFFLDSGSFARPAQGDPRLYNVVLERYDQTVTASVNLRPVSGAVVFISQSLINSKIHSVQADTRDTSNNWNLSVGANISRNLGGAGSLQGTVQRIQAYTERRNPGDPNNERDDWLAAVTFHKDF